MGDQQILVLIEDHVLNDHAFNAQQPLPCPYNAPFLNWWI
jgi:hypothetical protein